MYRKHSFEERLNLVSQVKNGQPIDSLCRLHQLDRKMLCEWVGKYDLYGEEGLHPQPLIQASFDFKEKVVKLAIEKSISLSQIVLQYGVSRSTLKNWIKIVNTDGYIALHHPNRSKREVNPMGRPKKRNPETELEKLQAENARLKAENALLKKVKALVEEREARERMNGRRPSKD